jgi:hypothetical protein
MKFAKVVVRQNAYAIVLYYVLKVQGIYQQMLFYTQ